MAATAAVEGEPETGADESSAEVTE
jgi:hypothetical protein